MVEDSTYVGLDVHKDMIEVAIADGLGEREVRVYGRIANRTAALERLLKTVERPGRIVSREVV